MKAITYRKYGGPEVMKMEELSIAEPGPKEILVKVKNAAVNPFDWRFLRGKPFLARMSSGLLKPKQPILGADLSGIVEKVGSEVTRFEAGDAIMAEAGHGGFGQYAVVREDLAVKKPNELSFPEAAALPMVSLTALKGINDLVTLKPGQKVLINGASGGIGTIAVQFAHFKGTHVTAVCSGRNSELVLSLGADKIIDYTKDPLRNSGGQWDIILDTVGNIPLNIMLNLLNPLGCGVVAGFTTMGNMLPYMLKNGKTQSHGKSVLIVNFEPAAEELQVVADLAAQGTIKAVIDRFYSLEQVPEAIAYSETKRARGKILIDVDGAK